MGRVISFPRTHDRPFVWRQARRMAMLAAVGVSLLIEQSVAQSSPVSPLCSEYDRTKLHALLPIPGGDGVVMDCVHHNAARLAGGRDTEEEVAQVAVDLCALEVSEWAYATWRARRLGTLEERQVGTWQEMVSEARIEVVRQRAGHCSQPAANDF